jgi:hypothetical protein
VSIDGGITIGGGAITACAWVEFKTFGDWSRILDVQRHVGNGAYSDNIYLSNRDATNTLGWSIRRGSTYRNVDIGNILELDKWTHVCGTV